MSLQQPARIFRRAPQREAARRIRRIAATAALVTIGTISLAVLAELPARESSRDAATHLAAACAAPAESSLHVRRLRC